MDILCARCRAPIAADDVNLDSRLAKCRACNAVFDFSAQLSRAGGGGAGAPLARRRATVPLPEGMKIVEDSVAVGEPDYRLAPTRTGRLVLTRSWFKPQLLFMLFFCIAWDSFLVFWYAMALGGSGPFSLLMVVFPICHVAVGVGLTYSTLAGFVNKTWITATTTSLSVRHGPLPWLGNRTLPASTLDQLYCEENTSTTKNGARTASYALSAVLKDGRKVRLLSSLESADQALFIEQRVEDLLGIEDRPVGGEHRG